MSKHFTKVSVSIVEDITSMSLANGAVGAPSLNFTNSPTTGLYSITNDINFALSGTNYVSFTSSLATIEMPTVIDTTSATAFLVRANNSGGDKFTVNTTSERVIVDGTTPELYIGNGTTTTANDLNFYISAGSSLIRWYEGATLRAYMGHAT